MFWLWLRIGVRSEVADVQNSDNQTQQSLKAKGWTLDNALDNFVDATHKAIRAEQRTPVVWQEMVRVCDGAHILTNRY